jgi:glutamate dehydrogenase/leucine dehydrogenase
VAVGPKAFGEVGVVVVESNSCKALQAEIWVAVVVTVLGLGRVGEVAAEVVMEAVD